MPILTLTFALNLTLILTVHLTFPVILTNTSITLYDLDPILELYYHIHLDLIFGPKTHLTLILTSILFLTIFLIMTTTYTRNFMFTLIVYLTLHLTLTFNFSLIFYLSHSFFLTFIFILTHTFAQLPILKLKP